MYSDAIEETLSQSYVKIIDSDVTPSDICILPNDNIVISSYTLMNYCNSFTVYDSNFKLIKVINNIGGKRFNSFSLTTNNIDRIYINDDLNYCIIMTDLEFKKIKEFNLRKVNPKESRFLYGICYENENVYVCNYDNNCVVKLSKDLGFICSIKCQCKPWLIKSNIDTFCVTSGENAYLFFYSIDEHELKHTYYHINNGRISVVNSLYYELIPLTKEVFVYDATGLLIKNFIISTNLNNYITSPWDGCMVYFKDNILITCHGNMQILALEIKRK